MARVECEVVWNLISLVVRCQSADPLLDRDAKQNHIHPGTGNTRPPSTPDAASAPASNQPAHICKLELVSSESLYGVVESMTVLRARTALGQRDALLLTFRSVLLLTFRPVP